ncbi:NUDIX hydrolase [Flaviflagellibacter deserti]|uniref:NUDIX hydrolase n=1 Tax=Flaviflagellibacter deserti TaxID=2267266 RepID=A0ABV9Z352_9HYPH
MSILNPSGRAPIVGDVTSFECRMVDEVWPWAENNSAAIAANWATAKARKPELFDGEVIIARSVEITGSQLVSTHTIVSYSALMYWQSLNFPPAGAFNLFGAAAVVTSDGALLFGRMAAHTNNAGNLYFPCGTPDRADIVDDRLDIEGSILRELDEETGLGAYLTATDDRWIVWDGGLFGCMRRYDTALDAAQAAEAVAAYLAKDEKPELSEVVFARAMSDIDQAVTPAYARAIASQILPD